MSVDVRTEAERIVAAWFDADRYERALSDSAHHALVEAIVTLVLRVQQATRERDATLAKTRCTCGYQESCRWCQLATAIRHEGEGTHEN